jgi:hypothetical protein
VAAEHLVQQGRAQVVVVRVLTGEVVLQPQHAAQRLRDVGRPGAVELRRTAAASSSRASSDASTSSSRSTSPPTSRQARPTSTGSLRTTSAKRAREGVTGAPGRRHALGRDDVGARQHALGARPVAHDDELVVPAQQLAQQVAETAVRRACADHDTAPDVGRSRAQRVASPGWLRGRHVSDTRATAP